MLKRIIDLEKRVAKKSLDISRDDALRACRLFVQYVDHKCGCSTVAYDYPGQSAEQTPDRPLTEEEETFLVNVIERVEKQKKRK